MENEQEKEVNDKDVDVTSIVDALKREGHSNDEIVEKLKVLLREGKITDEDFKKKVDELLGEERKEASKLFDMDL